MEIFKKLKTGASKAAEVAQHTVEVTKLTTRIASRKREIEKYKSFIGHRVYEAFQAGDMSLAEVKITEWCKAIEGVEAEIASLEQRIKRMHNEKECPCGKLLPADARFCQDCGRPQVSVKAAVINIKGEPRAEEHTTGTSSEEAGAVSEDDSNRNRRRPPYDA